MNFGAVVAVCFWGACVAVFGFGCACDLRRWLTRWFDDRDRRRLIAAQPSGRYVSGLTDRDYTDDDDELEARRDARELGALADTLAEIRSLPVTTDPRRLA